MPKKPGQLAKKLACRKTLALFFHSLPTCVWEVLAVTAVAQVAPIDTALPWAKKYPFFE